MKVNIDISCKYFPVLAYQISAQLSCEMLDILTAFNIDSFYSRSFVDRQTDKSQDQAPKQHHTRKQCEMKMATTSQIFVLE